MQYHAANHPFPHWLRPAGSRLKRALDRNPALRLITLGLLNGAAGLLLLSPAIILASASLAALWLYGHIQGPLDWFFTEVLCALALVAGWIGLQQLRARPPRPDGVLIDAQDAPDLFGMLERRAAHFRLRPPDKVILTDDATLTVQRIPRYAVPLAHTHILTLGAPLLFFLSRDLFRLALAGAIAAHARKQRGLQGWILRRCEDWPQIIGALQARPGLTARLLVPALQGVDALNTLLSRELHEDIQQDANRWVSEQTDEQQAEQLLASQVLTDLYLRNQYWPMIMKAADRCPTPVVKPFNHFELLLGKTLNRDTANRWLLQAQTCRSDNRVLRDLLAGLGLERLRWAGLPEQPASTRLLSPSILKALDRDWQTRIQPQWDEHHARFQHDLKRFKQLQQQHSEQPLQNEPAMRYIQLAKQLLDTDDMAKICQSVCESNHNDAALNFACGRQLVEAGHSQAGCEALRRAAELDAALAHRAQAIINEQDRAWLREDTDPHRVQA